MKKIILSAITMILISGLIAQNKFRLGVAYNLSTSNILSSGNNMSGMGSGTMTSNSEMNSDMGWKMGTGIAIRGEYYFNDRWGAYLQTGYQQRGGIYKAYMDDYKPRYRLNYWDVNIGAQFRTKSNAKGTRFITNLGITQHTLLSANRVYDMGSDNIRDEFNTNDVGIFLGTGCNIPVFGKDIFQVLLFGNYSITQMYAGNFEMNGMTGKNVVLGIQAAYLIGKPLRK